MKLHIKVQRIENRSKNKEATEMRIGAWNMKTMNKAGKLENIHREMIKQTINILRMNEVQWEKVKERLRPENSR